MRLDHYLVSNNLVKTRSEGLDLIKSGFVLVNDKVVTKGGYDLNLTDVVTLTKTRLFVSRAGEKLKDALDFFDISLNDKTIIDIGSSTGGFTDCALNYGAKCVYAYDVGTDQMDQKLRNNPKVILHEQTNILDVTIPVNDVILIDVSFTSVKPILYHIKNQAKELIVLLKPQFETEGKYLKNGVLKSDKIIGQVIDDFIKYLKTLNLQINGYKQAAITGKDGNKEFLFYLVKRESDVTNT